MKLGIVILNWNDFETTAGCLRRLAEWDGLMPEIIVVDNGSTDGSAEKLAAQFPGIHLVRSKVNRGFAGGNNLGIVNARELGCEAVMLLNSDAEIAEAGVAALLRRLQDCELEMIIGPAIEEVSSSGRRITCGGRDIGQYSRTRILKDDLPHAVAYVLDGKDPVQELMRDVDYVPGTVLLTTMQVFERVGRLDEDYFFSGEVADFCARARGKGVRCVVDMAVTARHGDAQTKPLRGSLYIYYTLRNRFLYVSRHGEPNKGWLKFVWTCKGLAMLVLAMVRLDFSKARAVRLAISDGLRGKWGNRNAVFGA